MICVNSLQTTVSVTALKCQIIFQLQLLIHKKSILSTLGYLALFKQFRGTASFKFQPRYIVLQLINHPSALQHPQMRS